MNIWKRLDAWLDKNISLKTLTKLILLLLIILLIRSTDVVWKGIFSKIWQIIEPFFYGFLIAYVFRPLIVKLSGKHISQKVSITIIYALLLVFLLWLFYTLIPLLFSRLSSFITSLISGVGSLSETMNGLVESGMPNWFNELVESVVAALQDTKSYLPQIYNQMPSVFNTAFHTVTIFIITFIVSIYICSAWDSVRDAIFRFFRFFSKNSDRYVHAVNHELGGYLRSLLVLMIIKFAEYSLMYFLVGHQDWLLIGMLTAIGLIVPYVGATVANVIGILTALNMPLARVIILIVCIIILSNVDAYVIGPLVHSHNVEITPLWALFSIFAGGAIAGGYGVMAGIPVYLTIRAIVNTAHSQPKAPVV